MSVEALLLPPALGCYALAGAGAVVAPHRGLRIAERHVFALLLAGLGLHTAALAARWYVLGHGPFTTMYEILSSNVWSLLVVMTAAYLRWAPARPALLVGLPIVGVLAAWMLAADASPGHLPPTYATSLLYVHVVLGKFFLGLLIVAVSIGGLVWLRRTRWGARRLAALPADAALDELAYRFAAGAVVFDTLMLISGAMWAQDAWGRYWAWDPLETWAFLTWLALVALLHARATWRLAPRLSSLLLLGVFVLAFLTFFGIPFVSTSPHKGAI